MPRGERIVFRLFLLACAEEKVHVYTKAQKTHAKMFVNNFEFRTFLSREDKAYLKYL